MRKLKDRIVLWTAYFDSSRKRREGRRMPLNLSLPHPSLQELVKAAESLNLNPEPKPEARFPRCWWTAGGYVIVDKLGSKQETLKKVAEKLLELRGRR